MGGMQSKEAVRKGSSSQKKGSISEKRVQSAYNSAVLKQNPENPKREEQKVLQAMSQTQVIVEETREAVQQLEDKTEGLQGKVEVVLDKSAKVAQTTQQTQVVVEEISYQVQQLGNQTQTVSDSMDRQAQEVRKAVQGVHQTQVVTTETREAVQQLDGKAEALNEKVDVVLQRASKIAQTTQQTEVISGEIQSSVQGLDGKIDRIMGALDVMTPVSLEHSVSLKLDKLRSQILQDVNIEQELATYIPVSGAYRITDTTTFDLESKVQEFLSSEQKKVFLLLGSAGGGKSTFNRYLEKRLWGEYQEGGAIPLFISLPTLQDPENHMLQEHFESVGFNPNEVDYLKKNHRFLLILDGYDETHQLSNFYLHNHLENWKAKVLISCRTDYLTKVAGNYLMYFMPYAHEKPQPSAITEMTVVPFSDAQIEAYITKYLQIHKDNPDKELLWTDPHAYLEQINKIPGLKRLIETPFLLMVCMDVMPRVIHRVAEAESQEKRLTMTRAFLMDEFVGQLFEREENKLLIRGEMPLDGHDVKEDFWAFAMELAVTMQELEVLQVQYAPGSALFSGKKESPWEKFFGMPKDKEEAENLSRARQGCTSILRTTGKNRYAFIHATLRDYLTVRKSKLEEEGDEFGFSPELPEPTGPTSYRTATSTTTSVNLSTSSSSSSGFVSTQAQGFTPYRTATTTVTTTSTSLSTATIDKPRHVI